MTGLNALAGRSSLKRLACRSRSITLTTRRGASNSLNASTHPFLIGSQNYRTIDYETIYTDK